MRSPLLFPLWSEAQRKLSALRTRGCMVELRWHAREFNEAADAASKAALSANGVMAAERTPPAGWSNRLGDIGEKLGVPALKVGKMLAAAALRSGKAATQKALKEGYASERFNGFGTCVDWNVEKCAALLKDAMDAQVTAFESWRHGQPAGSGER